VLSLSKHRSASAQKERPFDKLRANGFVRHAQRRHLEPHPFAIRADSTYLPGDA
jgi:hypothetical protein